MGCFRSLYYKLSLSFLKIRLIYVHKKLIEFMQDYIDLLVTNLCINNLEYNITFDLIESLADDFIKLSHLNVILKHINIKCHLEF